MAHAYYSPDLDDFEDVAEDCGLKRIVEGEDAEFRGGFSLNAPGRTAERVLLMDEFFLCVRGRLRATISDPPHYEESTTYELSPNDALFQGKGSKVEYAYADDRETLLFYVAIPASVKGLNPHIFPPSSDRIGSMSSPNQNDPNDD